MALGAASRQRLHDPVLQATELEFLASLAPAFTELEDSPEATLYIDGAAKLMTAERVADVSELNLLMESLERRVSLLEALRAALSESQSVAVRIGAENELPALRSLALVAATYGLPQRALGTVSVIGPLRMNYGEVIGAVRDAAAQLSAFVEEVYDERSWMTHAADVRARPDAERRRSA